MKKRSESHFLSLNLSEHTVHDAEHLTAEHFGLHFHLAE
jgi:hypothetical protein